MKNISSFVREGENILTVKLLWHQSEETTDGLPFFRGNLIMSQTVEIQKQNVVLRIPGRYQTANIFVNKKHIGELLFEREKNISEYVVQGINKIEIEYCIGNRNLLGPLHYMNKEEFVALDTFEQCDVYDNVSKLPKYKLHRFHKKE